MLPLYEQGQGDTGGDLGGGGNHALDGNEGKDVLSGQAGDDILSRVVLAGTHSAAVMVTILSEGNWRGHANGGGGETIFFTVKRK